MGFQTKDEAKAALNTEQYEEWLAFFGYYSAGGLRTPNDEVADLIGARQMMQGSSRAMSETRDYMLFPPPVTQDEIDRKARAFAAAFKAMGPRKK